MSIAEFVSHLRNLDVRLSAEGQRLRLNAPKGVLTDSLRAQIAARKQELLQFLSDYEQPPPFIPPPILRQTTGESAPLSFSQERLWFLEQLEPGNPVYNICRASRITGKLNLSALESSLNEIVRRHEILRSSICVADGRPVQVVQSPFELNLSSMDLHATYDVEQKIRHRIQQTAEAPFDFAAGKFLRAELLRVADDEYVLILATHHIVSDAWSMGILTRELWSLYETYAAGKSSQLEELQIQYADFAIWQREWLQEEVLEGQVSYWKEQLKDLTQLNLPIDRPRPARQSFEAARIPISLPETLTTAIHELSNQDDVTPFMILLATFQVLLFRDCGQEEIVVGSPIANRARTELESLIGFFVNTLVLRSDLSGSPAFKAHLARVREVCLGAYAHQDLPFEKLVQELQPEREQSRNPLFQVMFALQNATRPFSGIPGLRIKPLEIESTRSPFDLSLFLREREGSYTGFIEYDTDLFNGDRIERMATHYRTLLEAIVADPNQSIATLPILTEAERHKILVEWNDTAADYPKDSCIHELFEAQVERKPEAIAVQFEGEQLTYRELNTRANQLAHYLQGLGVGPEKLVGICVQRSLEMVVGLLGILKAGGTYVPLDPSYPKERLAFIMEDSQVSVLLTSARIIEGLKMRDSDSRSSILDPQMKMVCLDTNWDTIARESEQNPGSEVKPDNLAYVIHTSGSTGTPKGVAIEHRNTVNLLQWANTAYGPRELAGVLASTSICFDLSVFEIFLPLCCGGRVILVENALCLDSTLERNDLTLINTVPSVMVELLRVGQLPKSVCTVNLAGEPLRAELVKQIYDLGHIEKIYDLYGPSETTTYSTFTLRTPDGPNTIGRPISNTQVYILDSHLQPVPVGGCGEIYIGGDGMARGYLHRPELTSERFVPHPFSDDPANRLYRTGDRARYRLDGNIEFLGRTDNQVKIRGYRIEVGEIEIVLKQHPAVKDNVVVVRQRESSAEKSLFSYVVPRQPSPSLVLELRNFLKRKLPEYMVPSAFVILDTLPLLPNGKVDRQKLLPRDDTGPQLAEQFVAPHSEIEELVAQVWEEVLKIENIGIHDNFFELGGHSLLAVQIISRLRDAFNREVPLSALFETPTVVGLAVTVENLIRGGPCPELPPIVSVSRNGPLPLSLNQEHLWHLDQSIPGTHFFNMPYVYRLSGDVNIEALRRALKEIIRRHETLRTVFTKIHGRPVQIIRPFHDFEIPVVSLDYLALGELERQAADLILEERQQSFDLTLGPLIRIKLLRLTDSEHILMVTLHHIITDHWSMWVFRTELVALYEAFSEGRPSPLSEPSIQFVDYVCWERDWIGSECSRPHLPYWKKQLVSPLPLLEFQKECERKNTISFRTSHQPFQLNEALFADIKALAREENCTPFIVLVSALSIVLHQSTGQRDIRIGTLVANRRRETEQVIGHFLNTVILRTQVCPDKTFRQLLMEVRDVAVGAYAHQELPFERLAKTLEEEQEVERGSLFQVLFSYQRSSFESQKIVGLTFAPFDLQQSTTALELEPTTFDMVFKLWESSTTLTGSVNYKADFISEEFVVSMVERFGKVLKSMGVHGEQLIKSTSFDEEPQCLIGR